ncbi:MAG: hypothetical protein ACK5DV_17030 [Planctomycetota bacterium]|jgi:hypothetical protein
MSTAQSLFGLALVLGIAIIGLWTAWKQCVTLSHEQGDTAESRFFRGQASRRLVIAFILVFLGAMLGGAMILLEEPAQVIADLRDRADMTGTTFHLDDSQERFASIYGSYWLAFFLVFFILLAILAYDVLALRAFRLNIRRNILNLKRQAAAGSTTPPT